MDIRQEINVLIVDDYIMMVKIMRNLLTQLGFEHITEETNAFAALEKLHNQPFQLIISDWDMETMSGQDFLNSVRQDKTLGEIPLVMVTDTSKLECAHATKEAGSAAYIVKPFNILTLKSKLVGVLGEF